MQENITEADILDFLDKLKLLVSNLGQYEYYSSNEHFQYLIKTSNHTIVVSMADLIANRNKQLSQEKFKAIAAKLEVKPAPTAKQPDRQVVFEKRVDAGYKVIRNLLYLFLIGAAIVIGLMLLNQAM